MTAPVLALYAAAPAWLQVLLVLAMVLGGVVVAAAVYTVATWVFFGHRVRTVVTVAATVALLATGTVSVDTVTAWVQARWAGDLWIRLGAVVLAGWPVWLLVAAAVRRPRPVSGPVTEPFVPRPRAPVADRVTAGRAARG